MKGSAWVWLVTLMLIFLIILVYNVFSFPLASLEPTIKSFINTTVTSQNSTAGANALVTIGQLDIVWQYWPMFFIFGILMWAFISNQRAEPQVYEG